MAAKRLVRPTWINSQEAVPFIAYWPGTIPAGVSSNQLASGLDLVPTVFDLLDLPPPKGRQIDGFSIKPLLLERKPGRRNLLFYNNDDTLYGVRDGAFKYQIERPYSYGGAEIGAAGYTAPKVPWLFDLVLDPNESYNVSGKHPDHFKQLRSLLEQQAEELKENPRGWIDTP